MKKILLTLSVICCLASYAQTSEALFLDEYSFIDPNNCVVFPESNGGIMSWGNSLEVKYNPIEADGLHLTASGNNNGDPHWYSIYDGCQTMYDAGTFVDMSQSSKVTITAKGEIGETLGFHVGALNGGTQFYPNTSTYNNGYNESIEARHTFQSEEFETFTLDFAGGSWEIWEEKSQVRSIGFYTEGDQGSEFVVEKVVFGVGQNDNPTNITPVIYGVSLSGDTEQVRANLTEISIAVDAADQDGVIENVGLFVNGEQVIEIDNSDNPSIDANQDTVFKYTFQEAGVYDIVVKGVSDCETCDEEGAKSNFGQHYIILFRL